MKLIRYSLFVLVIIISNACTKKFLDVPDPATLIRQSYVTDLNATSDALGGIYVMLAQNFYYGYYQVYPEIVADNIKMRTATATDMVFQYNWDQPANTSSSNRGMNMNGIWLDGYQIISYCNFIVAKAEEYRNQNSAKTDDAKAQALTLRALVHFTLVNIFAQTYGFTADASHPGIPYVTNYDWTNPATKRNTVAEVYSSLISDLTTAIPLFATSTTINKLYLTKDAAKAILARIYLFKNDFQSAKDIAAELSAKVPIMSAGVAGYPSKLFTLDETEAFFQLIPSAQITIPTQQGANLSSPISSFSGTYTTYFQGNFFSSQKKFIATSDIATAISQNNTDLRKVWVAPNGDILKNPSDVIPGFQLKSGSYYNTLFRSSEMNLIASESYAQLNNEDSARYYLNQIRTRANIPAVTSTVTGTALKDSIYLERRRELCFEGLRMFDLQRWKKAVDRQDTWNAVAKTLPYPSDKAIAPIPQNDVLMLGLQQNNGY